MDMFENAYNTLKHGREADFIAKLADLEDIKDQLSQEQMATLLGSAIEKDHIFSVYRILLDLQADPHAADHKGRPPAWTAVKNESVSALRLLQSFGLNPSQTFRQGDSNCSIYLAAADVDDDRIQRELFKTNNVRKLVEDERSDLFIEAFNRAWHNGNHSCLKYAAQTLHLLPPVERSCIASTLACDGAPEWTDLVLRHADPKAIAYSTQIERALELIDGARDLGVSPERNPTWFSLQRYILGNDAICQTPLRYIIGTEVGCMRVPAVLDLLDDLGVPVETTDDIAKPMCRSAIRTGNLEMFDALVDRGVKPDRICPAATRKMYQEGKIPDVMVEHIQRRQEIMDDSQDCRGAESEDHDPVLSKARMPSGPGTF